MIFISIDSKNVGAFLCFPIRLRIARKNVILYLFSTLQFEELCNNSFRLRKICKIVKNRLKSNKTLVIILLVYFCFRCYNYNTYKIRKSIYLSFSELKRLT